MSKVDIIVHGATGFTGRLIAEYLSTADSARNISWGISGRSQEKLDELAAKCEELISKSNGKRKIERPLVFVADAHKELEVKILVEATRVLIACAGPFSIHGMPVAKACVEAGTHYVDITGEFPYVRKLIEEVHEEAEKKEVLLLPCCGFDCVPSDIINAYTHQEAQQQNLDIRRVDVAISASGGGGASRGTLESIAHLFKTLEPEDKSMLSLVDKDVRDSTPAPATRFPRYHSSLRSFVGPFFMSVINERVVRRSNSLASDKQRRESSYVEMGQGNLLAIAGMLLMNLMTMLLMVPAFVKFFRKHVFPAEGQGPTERKGSFRYTALGYADAAAKTPKIRAVMRSSIDGYTFTAMSAAETALALAANEIDSGVKGGVRPPGAAVSKALIRRLQVGGKVKIGLESATA